jgi:hypothetical protein
LHYVIYILHIYPSQTWLGTCQTPRNIVSSLIPAEKETRGLCQPGWIFL